MRTFLSMDSFELSFLTKHKVILFGKIVDAYILIYGKFWIVFSDQT